MNFHLKSKSRNRTAPRQDQPSHNSNIPLPQGWITWTLPSKMSQAGLWSFIFTLCKLNRGSWVILFFSEGQEVLFTHWNYSVPQSAACSLFTFKYFLTFIYFLICDLNFKYLGTFNFLFILTSKLILWRENCIFLIISIFWKIYPLHYDSLDVNYNMKRIWVLFSLDTVCYIFK